MMLLGLTIVLLSSLGLIIAMLRTASKASKLTKENNHPDGEFRY